MALMSSPDRPAVPMPMLTFTSRSSGISDLVISIWENRMKNVINDWSIPLGRDQKDRHHADDTDRFSWGQQYGPDRFERSEEHTSELQSLMRSSYAVFCMKKKKINIQT